MIWSDIKKQFPKSYALLVKWQGLEEGRSNIQDVDLWKNLYDFIATPICKVPFNENNLIDWFGLLDIYVEFNKDINWTQSKVKAFMKAFEESENKLNGKS